LNCAKSDVTIEPPPADVIIALEGISKHFASGAGCVHVFNNLTVIISEGEFVVLTGPSGSGKTTLLHMLALLGLPSFGTIFFDGQDISNTSKRELCLLRGSSIGMVFQRFYLLPRRTVVENIRFRFRYMDIPDKTVARHTEEAMRRLGILHLKDRKARLLSGGEMQRVSIARAVALPPRLLVVDEPTGNLDRTSSDRVMAALQSLWKSGVTIVLGTHDEIYATAGTRRILLDKREID